MRNDDFTGFYPETSFSGASDRHDDLDIMQGISGNGVENHPTLRGIGHPAHVTCDVWVSRRSCS